MLKNLLNSIEEKYNTRKQENNNLNNLLNTTSTFQNLFPMPSLTNEISDYKVSLITSTCPDINEEKAKLISKLIPIKETYLSVHYIKEVLTTTRPELSDEINELIDAYFNEKSNTLE